MGTTEIESLLKFQYFDKNFDACVKDARKAALDSEDGPKDPLTFEDLLSRARQARDRFPPLYREHVVDPFIARLDALGAPGFYQVMLRDPYREREVALMMDIAQSLLQRHDRYQEKASAAFQEVVSDLYDGFLSVEDRKSIRGPVRTIVPPLVKWGCPEQGPYTWPCQATKIFGVRASIVNMPPANARTGLLAWTGLAHETAGHDVMSANEGLVEELSETVRKQLTEAMDLWISADGESHLHQEKRETLDRFVDYWSMRVEEAASDVLGILNMGPTAAVGLVGYLQAMNQAWGAGQTLRYGRTAHAHDPHPMDLMRGYLAAFTVRKLKYFGAREAWALWIEKKVADSERWALADGSARSALHTSLAKKTADVVAEVIVNARMTSLSNHCLSQIQTWGNHDEDVVRHLLPRMRTLGSVEEVYTHGYYAAHVVAAAVSEALLGESADLSLIFSRMIGILRQMHDCNPSWGPLYVEHPSDFSAMRMYVPAPKGDLFHAPSPDAKPPANAGG